MCHGYPACDTIMANTFWQIQLVSYDFARKWMQGHYICMWKLWNKRYFATRWDKTLPCIWKSSQWPLLHAWTLAEQTFMARNVGFLARQGSIPLKEGFQILRCWKCLKHGSKFQQFQGSTARNKNHHEVKCVTSLGCAQFCSWEAVLQQHLTQFDNFAH